MGILTVERAKQMAKLLTINAFEYNEKTHEGLNPNVIYETKELEEKIKNYVGAKKELEEFLELDRQKPHLSVIADNDYKVISGEKYL